MTDGIYLKKKVFFGYTDISAAGRYVDWYRISYHQRNSIGGVMVSMLASNPVDRGFIGGVMVSMLASNPVDRGFMGGVMVSMLASNPVDHGFIGGVMVSMLASNPVDRGFEPCSGQTKDYKIDICCFRIILVGFE
jgi:hypothetical protein